MQHSTRFARLLFLLIIAVLVLPPTLGLAVQIEKLSADKMFASDRVVVIDIELDKKDWDSIRLQTRSFVDALGKEPAVSPFTYVKANIIIDGVRIEEVGIRKKGFLGSLSNDRPSIKIKFEEYRKQDPVDGLDRLTLNNNNQDAARVCQYLSYKLFNESGTFSPRCGFAKVTVNGDYLGIYSNVESVKPGFLERGFGDGSGDCFEGTLADFFPAWTQKFEPKNKKATLSDINKIAELLDSDDVDLDELRKLIDVDAFVNFWAMESLIGFWDGYCANQNNFFIYQNPKNSKFYFIPWGTDSSFTQTTPLPPYRIRPKAVHAKAILPNKLYRIPEIQKQYTETLMSFLEKHWNEEQLIAEIDRLEALLKDDLIDSNRDFSGTMDKYRKFVETRRDNLMREFKDGPPELRSREQLPVYFSEMGNGTVNFSTKWYDQTPGNPGGLGDVKLDVELEGEKVEFENVYAFAERSKWPSPEKVKPATVIVSGTRKSDGKKLTFAFSMPEAQFKPTGTDGTETGGIYFVDFNFMPETGMQMIGGTAVLEKASTKNGEPVVGQMKFSIKRMKAGKPVDEQ